MTKRGETVNFKKYTRKIKFLFMISAYFESILISENNGKENPDEPYTNKYQSHLDCNVDYKLVRADDQFSKCFKSYLDQDAVITNMLGETKYCSRVMKKRSNKGLAMTKEDNENCKRSTWICDITFVEGDVKVRDHFTSLKNTEALHKEIVISRLN